MTLTQEPQPYGPLCRTERTVDGIVYVVIGADSEPGPHGTTRRRWNLLRRVEGGACEPEGRIYLDAADDADDAARRFGVAP